MPFAFGTAVAPARCSEDDVASSPTQRLLLCASGFSGWSLMVVRAGLELRCDRCHACALAELMR